MSDRGITPNTRSNIGPQPPVTAPVHPGGWVDGIGWVALSSDLASGDVDVATWPEEPGIPGSRYVSPVIVTRWADGSTPQAPTVDGVPVPREALDRLIGCHRFFCKSSTTPCCPAGEWIAAAEVSSDR